MAGSDHEGSDDNLEDRHTMTLAFPHSAEPIAGGKRRKIMFVVTEDWYFVSHRLALAIAARDAGYEVHVATRVDRHAEVIRDSGLELHPVAFNRGGLGPAEDFRTIAQLTRLYRQQRPDLVHHVALKPVLYGSFAARIARVPAVVNALGGLGYVFSSETARARVLRLMARPALKLALGGANSRLIVQNAEHRDRMMGERLARAGSVRLVRGAGVEPSLYRQAEVMRQPPLIVLPARLLREKGVREFVSAARLLREQGLIARFALVGQPDPMNPASVSQAEVDAWAKEGVVEAWGWRDDMPAVFGQAQIACLPSYHEGLPKALLEAAACGCAIVATDIPGCREIVEHGRNGLLVPVRDEVRLAAALRTLIERPGLRQQYGVAARQRLESEFSMSKVVRDTFAIYDELLAP
jgi:glycosyltransferase involved in cell wall biosynthesis